MKHFLLFFIFVLFAFSFVSQNRHKNNHIDFKINRNPNIQSTSLPSISKNAAKHKDIETKGRWYNDAIENIRNNEYDISYSEELSSYQSPNRMNNIRFIYHNDGFTAKTRESKIPLFDLNDREIKEENKKYKVIPEWSIRFRTLSLQHEFPNYLLTNSIETGALNFDGSQIKAEGNKASVENDNIRVDYTNTEKGMRQDFLIKSRPHGNGKLKLELSAETNLSMNVEKGVLRFKDEDENVKMMYSSLKVWDASGKQLTAGFEKSNISNERIEEQMSNHPNFCIVLDDHDAIYPITIDPLSTAADWAAESNMEDAAFGYSVSSAGDVNGDGFSDVIVGAFLYDNGQTDEGRAFVYHGSADGLSSLENWTGESDQANAQFGYSVSSAGDVNGDGYSDVIIGANIYNNDQADEGRAFVYYGSAAGLSASPGWISESNQEGCHYGWSVSTAGDVNNDGFSDVIVGAPLYDNGQSDGGRAFVYYGSLSGPSGTANWTAEGNQAVAFFGYSVSAAGDVNGDGYSDVIVGANRYDTPVLDHGRAFVYYGSPAGLSFSPNWVSESFPLGFFIYFGNSVSTAGDVNGDSYSDVIIGAYSYDQGQPDEGKVFVYHGSALGLSPVADWSVESNQPFARFGNSVSTAGDVNNDGYSDVIVGASEYDNGESNEGAAFVYHGSPSGLSSFVNWTVENDQANSLFGISVSTAGDVNGDGFSDMIVGAYLHDNGQSNEGSAFVFHGSNGVTTPDSLELRLTLFVEGFYDANSNTMIEDTVRVYLRNAEAPHSIVDSAKTRFNTTGTGTFLFRNASSEGNYYIQVKHRNSLETWSSRPVDFTDNFLEYDFSTSPGKAFGNNMVLVDVSPVRFAIFSGDINQDGNINATDISLTDNDLFNHVAGYVNTDLDGNNLVNLQDLFIVDNSLLNGASLRRP